MGNNSESALRPLVILGGGVHQLPYINYCSEKKIPNIVIDSNADAIAKDHADLFFHIDTSNEKKVLSEIERNCRREGIAGVLVAGVELAVLGAIISRRFATKFIDLNAAINATDKIARANKFRDCQIPYPRFEIVESVDSVSLSYPFVIKEQEGSGSRGVRIIFSERDRCAAVENFGNRESVAYLAEEFIGGAEISIEAFIHGEVFHYYCFAIRDIEYTRHGKVIEHGSISDPAYDDGIRSQVKMVFEKACSALGLREGPVKGDIIYSSSGPCVLEVASRSAPLAPLISGRIYGVDMVSKHISWVLNRNFVFESPPVPISKSKPVSHRILSHKPGILKYITGVDDARASKGILEVIVLRKLEFPMSLDIPDNSNRILYVVATGRNAVAARENADIALSKIKLVYE